MCEKVWVLKAFPKDESMKCRVQVFKSKETAVKYACEGVRDDMLGNGYGLGVVNDAVHEAVVDFDITGGYRDPLGTSLEIEIWEVLG